MTCYICNTAADIIPSEKDDFVYINCPECLEYKIPDIAVTERDEQEAIVSSIRDVAFIRGWLILQRIRQNSVAPIIPSHLIKTKRTTLN